MILQHWAEEILCSVTQSCPTLCNPIDCSLPGSSIHGDSPGNNTGVDCHDLLQRIFPIQGSNPHLLCLLHWQVDFLHWVRATQKAPGKQGEPVTNEGTSNRGMLETLQMWDWHNNKFDGVIFINLKHISDLYHNLSQWTNVGRTIFIGIQTSQCNTGNDYQGTVADMALDVAPFQTTKHHQWWNGTCHL